MNTVDFNGAMLRFGPVVHARSDQVLIASALELHASIRVGSSLTGSPGAPKATGYLQNSIQIGKGGTPSFKQSGEGPVDGTIPAGPTGTELVGLKVGTDVVIATNTVYAEVQEHMHKTKANHWSLSEAGWGRIVDHYAGQILEPQ